MIKVAIIGFGRFGQLLATLIRDDFDVSVVDEDSGRQQIAHDNGYKTIELELIEDVEHIFLAVPISNIESVIKEIAPLLNNKHVVSDVCSVKVYPAKLMQKYLSHCQIIASHPLFGPDSASKGLKGLKIILCPLNIEDGNFQIWKDFWLRKGVEVIIATPEEHDKDSVYSQAFTYSVARIITEMNIPKLRFTTRSFNDIKEVADLSANDSEQLFHDMLYYNPYFSEMKKQLEGSASKVFNILTNIEKESKNAG